MFTQLRILATRSKTVHSYKHSQDIHSEIDKVESAPLLTRIKWVFTGVKMQ